MSKAEIKSPLPGMFYHKPSPDSPPFKNDGDSVSAADVIGVVEVMKSFHEVTAGIDGKAIRFLVDDADAVMAGQTLAEVEA
jgi:acetyl-CoA carboxylase biotin carboxyl carrier protein